MAAITAVRTCSTSASRPRAPRRLRRHESRARLLRGLRGVSTDAGTGSRDTGFAFTTGRGNDIQATAIAALAATARRSRRRRDAVRRLGAFGRELAHDSQLRWLGPEKGVIHMAVGAVLNASWDLAPSGRASRCGSSWPTDARADRGPGRLPLPDRRDDPRRGTGPAGGPGRGASRARAAARPGLPGVHDHPGWLGYYDDKLRRLCPQAVADGFDLIKLKVGGASTDDVRRLGSPASASGPTSGSPSTRTSAGTSRRPSSGCSELAPFDPYWIEEPTSPDEILGHATDPARGRPGEGGHRRARAEPGRLQADAAGRVAGRRPDRRLPGSAA